ncbi:MAG TPA: cytochrome P450, partial [Acidimicrobiales bacterium]
MTSRHPPVTDWATDFDHTDPAWVADPYPIWADLRAGCPVAHSDRYGGTWLPVRQTDIAAVAYDTDNYTSRSVVVSEVRPGPGDLPAPIGVAPPITSDPPFHALARRMLLPAFSPKPIAALEPFTRDLCRGLLDAAAGRPEFDAAVEYAQHIPVRVIIGMLGFPQEDAAIFRRFIHQVLEDVDMSPEERQAVIADREIDAYMDARIAEHLAEPRDDLTTFLLNAELDGQKLLP